MTCKALETIARYDMLRGAASVCVGVSGGVDSVSLLHLLVQLRPQFGYTLQVVHVNHGLRGAQADADARFVEDLCSRYGVPCAVVNADVPALCRAQGVGAEEAGRMARYAAFAATGCDRIAVAHTRSDRIETSLFHLARGTGLKGAAGIPPVRGRVIRPLIDCTRAEVEAYARENGLRFVTDATNAADDYTRNALRHRVLEPLRGILPGFEASWARFLDLAAERQDYMAQQAEKALLDARLPGGWNAAALASLHDALLSECTAQLLSGWMTKPPEARHVALCAAAVKAGAGRVSLTSDRFFRVKNGLVSLETKQPEHFEPYCIPAQDGVFRTPWGVYRLREAANDDPTPACLRLDAEKLQGDLVLRTRLPGDRFAAPKRQGSKSFKKLFNEAGLSPETRAKTAVLCCGGNVAWVEGFSADRAFCADEETKTMLIVQKEELS